MFNFLKKLRVGNIYACVTGVHVGKLLIYIESTDSDHGFLATPTMTNLWVPKEKFDLGLQHGIIEFVERPPKYVRQTSKAQFEENKRTSRTSV